MAKNKISDNQIAFYQAPDGSVNIEVLYAEENIWLPQKRIAELFNTTVPNINMHLKNLFEKKEIDKDSVIKDFLATASDGKKYKTKFYCQGGYRILLQKHCFFARLLRDYCAIIFNAV